MKKLIATFIGGGVLGFIAGAGLMLIIFPFLFPPAPVDESVNWQRRGIENVHNRTSSPDAPGQR